MYGRGWWTIKILVQRLWHFDLCSRLGRSRSASHQVLRPGGPGPLPPGDQLLPLGAGVAVLGVALRPRALAARAAAVEAAPPLAEEGQTARARLRLRQILQLQVGARRVVRPELVKLLKYTAELIFYALKCVQLKSRRLVVCKLREKWRSQDCLQDNSITQQHFS